MEHPTKLKVFFEQLVLTLLFALMRSGKQKPLFEETYFIGLFFLTTGYCTKNCTLSRRGDAGSDSEREEVRNDGGG